MQTCAGFINVSDALTEAMLDHLKERPKSQNERCAAWERSGAKRNERCAAWERDASKAGIAKGTQREPHQIAQTVIFKRFRTFFGWQACPGRSRRIATQLEAGAPRAAWERDIFKIMSAALHGSTHALDTPRTRRGHAEEALGCPRPLPPDPQTTKREPFARRAFGKK